MSRRMRESVASRTVDDIMRSATGVPFGSLGGIGATLADDRLLTEWRRLQGRKYPLVQGLRVDHSLAMDYVRPEDVVLVERWAHCKYVLRFNPSMAEELRHQQMNDKIPTKALEMLPYPVMYVSAPVDVDETMFAGPEGGRYNTAGGFFAWIDKGQRDGIRTNKDCLYICYSFGESGLLRNYDCIELDNGRTLDEEVAWARETDYVNRTDDDYDAYKAGLTQTLQYLLYISSVKADIEVVRSPTRITHLGLQDSETMGETVCDVGTRIGSAIGAYRRELKRETEREERDQHQEGSTKGRRVPPHIRRGHWHYYWVGPRKGRTDGKYGDKKVLEWVHPALVNGGLSEVEVVHPVVPNGPSAEMVVGAAVHAKGCEGQACSSRVQGTAMMARRKGQTWHLL